MKRKRAVGIVIKEDKILLIFRRRETMEYYIFPGGGVEEDETREKAVIREVKEETSIEVVPLKLIYELEDSLCVHLCYLCSYKKGRPSLGDFNEKASMNKNNFFKPIWLPTTKLSSTTIYPREIGDWIREDIPNNFIHTPKSAYTFQ